LAGFFYFGENKFQRSKQLARTTKALLPMGLFDWLSKPKEAPSYSDEEILDIYRSKGPSGIRLMENELYRDVFAYLPHSRKAVDMLPDPDERRQAYADAFLDFSRQMKSGNFRGDASVKTYFTSIFNFKLIDFLKHKQTNAYKANRPGAVELEKRLEVLSQKSGDILHDLLTKEKLERAKALLKTLYAGKTPCHDLLIMAAEGIKQDKIAEHLGLTTGSVKTKSSDCRRQLLAQF